jgi:hypothetical protein
VAGILGTDRAIGRAGRAGGCRLRLGSARKKAQRSTREKRGLHLHIRTNLEVINNGRTSRDELKFIISQIFEIKYVRRTISRHYE